MAFNGSVYEEVDADRILEEVGENHFHPDFKEYMLKEQLKCWGHKSFCGPEWVFWSEQDHKIEPSLSLDNCADFNPHIKDNIRHALQNALQKLILSDKFLESCLVQFWAATTTLEGRTKLTTQYQPFALGSTDTTIERQRLCEYRMEMCSSKYNNFFYADAESGEEQLGLPGRVFLYKSTESTPAVEYYSTKEYPQRDLALRCKIRKSWAVPVFEHSSQTCVGVLEMVSLYEVFVYDESFRCHMYDSFQELGLQCFDGYQACEEESRTKGRRVKGLTQALRELRTVLTSVCKIHELPLAMAWVPCSDCNGLRQCKFGSTGVDFLSLKYRYKHHYGSYFLMASKCRHLGKGLVAERAVSFSNMLYCSDITKLSLDEYPLVPQARMCNLSGWFTICLQNVYTGNVIYVLEFFLSDRSKDDENILTTLSFILGTMEKNFKTFRLASGKELGELMSVDVIYFQNDQKIYSVQTIQATRDFSISIPSSSVQSSPSVAYKGPGFQDANMATIKGKYDLNSDPFFDSDYDPSFEQSSTSVAYARPGFQDADMVIIRAKYASIEIVLKLSLPCRLVELQQEVVKWLMLEAETYHAGYEDEEDGFVLIACDEDLQAYVDDSISQGNTSPVVLLKPKEPPTSLNPTN